MFPVNYLSVLVSAIASMAIGFVWYSPVLFGKSWMKLSKIDPKKMAAANKNMAGTYSLSFVAALVTAVILSVFLDYALASTVMEAAIVGLFAWLGFVATTLLTGVLFEGKPWNLFLINSGYQLASILAMSVILVMWPW